MGRISVRWIGLVAVFSLVLLVYLSGLDLNPGANRLQKPSPVRQPVPGARSLKTGNLGIKHAESNSQTDEPLYDDKPDKTEKPPLLDPSQTEESHLEQVQINGVNKNEIMKSVVDKSKQKLPLIARGKLKPKSLFSFSDYKPGKSSRPVQYGLNKSLYELNQEFSKTREVPSEQLRRLSVTAAPPFIKEKANRMDIVGGVPVGSRIPPNKARNILIATTWRSGSSFLGDLLNHYPGSFYYFEPLHYYSQITNLSTVIDRTTFLKTLYSCEFSSRNLGYLHHVAKPSNRFLFKCHNFRLWQNCVNLLPKETMCFMPDYLSTVCPVYPLKLIKTVRLRVRDTEPLVADPDLNLKMVVLVRDPRGVYASRGTGPIANWCKNEECADPTVGCRNLVDDVAAARDLENRFPGRVLLLRYEDLSLNTEDMVRSMLRFLDLPWMPEMTNYIVTHTVQPKAKIVRNKITKKVERKEDPYATTRNSTATAFKWRETLGWENITSLQDTCSTAMSQLGYELLESKEQTLLEELPIKNQPKDIWPAGYWD